MFKRIDHIAFIVKGYARSVKFYGDPMAGFISSDENYCAIGGCGLIIYYLREPFEEFKYNKKSEQWIELFREKEDIWWIDNITEGVYDEHVEFRVAPDEERAGTYELNVFTLEVKKLVK